MRYGTSVGGFYSLFGYWKHISGVLVKMRIKTKPIYLICPVCKKEFYQWRRSQVHCSTECSRESLKIKSRLNRERGSPRTIICNVCGKECIVYKKNVTTCELHRGRNKNEKEKNLKLSAMDLFLKNMNGT